MARLCILILALFLYSCDHDSALQKVRTIAGYPSASSVEYIDGRIYIMGDDATYMLVLDSNLNTIDSIPVFPSAEIRIPKNIKPDLEAMTVVPGKGLLLTGSASLMPYRYTAVLLDPVTRKIDSFRLDSFYQRFHNAGIEELNIEGMTAIPGAMVLSNRGHMKYRHNHLVFTSPHFWEDPAGAFISKVLFGFSPDTSSFQGVSGLAYGKRNDILIATVSTENTSNSYDDGAIGKSYLWLVKYISSKTRWKAINPDKIIDLASVDAAFRGQKIEGVCVISETKKFLYLALVADNDNGASSVFKVAIRI